MDTVYLVTLSFFGRQHPGVVFSTKGKAGAYVAAREKLVKSFDPNGAYTITPLQFDWYDDMDVKFAVEKHTPTTEKS